MRIGRSLVFFSFSCSDDVLENLEKLQNCSSKERFKMKVGDRCRVVVNKDKTHKHTWASGTIAFVGSTDFAGGVWIGVKLDEKGKGRNDGIVKGKRYFEAQDKEGIFVREKFVRVVIHDKSNHRRSSPQKKTTMNGKQYKNKLFLSRLTPVNGKP